MSYDFWKTTEPIARHKAAQYRLADTVEVALVGDFNHGKTGIVDGVDQRFDGSWVYRVRFTDADGDTDHDSYSEHEIDGMLMSVSDAAKPFK